MQTLTQNPKSTYTDKAYKYFLHLKRPITSKAYSKYCTSLTEYNFSSNEMSTRQCTPRILPSHISPNCHHPERHSPTVVPASSIEPFWMLPSPSESAESLVDSISST